MTSGPADLTHVLSRLAAAERRIRTAVARRRSSDPHPDDPFRGLYLSDAMLDSLLATPREPFDPVDPHPDAPDSRLTGLARAAGLTGLDVELLVLSLAPDVDSRFEQFYGYLNDDVTRRRVSVGLALRLCGLPEAAPQGRARLAPAQPLVRQGLVELTDMDRPLLSRTLRVPDRVVAHLLGDDSPDLALPVSAAPTTVDYGSATAERARRALSSGRNLLYLAEAPGGCAVTVAEIALRGVGRRGIVVDLARLCERPGITGAVRGLIREALLQDAGIVIGPVDQTDPTEALAILAQANIPVLAYGKGSWNPRWSVAVPLQLTAQPLRPEQRKVLWGSALGSTEPGAAAPAGTDLKPATLHDRLVPGVDPAVVCAHFVLSAPQLRSAASAAAAIAASQDVPIGAAQLRDGARSQNSASLERLARRIAPTVSWDDLVLPGTVLRPLRELTARVTYRDRVLDGWHMRPGGGRGRGVTGLFAGDSGTGKTMSAEVIAHDLGMDLYTVNLATVVDKYIGETEKNLERIFTEASGVNGVLLFDEADAIFGKRSEVQDARDRYANVESAYLLQRIETFDGFAILATNLRANLDEAFTRRLDVVVDFPMPDQAHRRRLWDRCLGGRVPRDTDLDLDFLASAFELAGGHIRSAAVTAAYLAASADRPVGMRDTVNAVAREYQKLGRLCLDREFGRYLDLVIED